MGDYDLPAIIDYILEYTSAPKLAYIGHSQGTTQMFYALAYHNKYITERVSAFVALSPVLRLSNSKSPTFLAMAWLWKYLKPAFEFIGDYELFSENWLTSETVGVACSYIP